MRTYTRAWPDRVWAVEGANGVGRPLAQRLLEAGEHVIDVSAKLAARVRLFDTGHNRKTDARDAHSIAVVAARTSYLRELKVDGELEALRMSCRSSRPGRSSSSLRTARSPTRTPPRRSGGRRGAAAG